MTNQTTRNICNSKVCVIGGAGFIGSHLVHHLIQDRSCQVLVLDNLISGQRRHIHSSATFEWFDIRWEPERLTKLLLSHGIEYVFNYAAEPYIPECFDNPMHFFQINAVAVLNVLNASKAANVKGILQVSSAEIYGDLKGKIKETDPVTPHSTYGVSKMAADGLVQVRYREAQVPAISLRQFNCVGERETHEYVIPEIISQLDFSSLVYLGNNSVRDFLYAGDAVRMATELLESGEFGEVYNMGSEEAIQIYDLVGLIAPYMGIAEPHIVTDESKKRPWEIWHLQSDNSKLYATIDARPEVSLEEALAKTVSYYYNNGHCWDW